MGKPPEGGGSLPKIASFILAICVIRTGGQIISQEYGCPSQEKILPCRCSTRGMEFQIWCSHSELPRVLEGLKAVSHYVTRPIDELILENNNLPSLPGNVFTSLRVLRLMLRNNRLERVSSSWLEGLDDSLLELFVVEPDLRTLPIDSLENLHSLEAITLQSKTMIRLPRFTGLVKLRYLQINSPSLIELAPLSFRNLPNLEQIHVFGSPRLSRLEAGFLRNLPRLSLVNVSNSAIKWLHPRTFIDLPKLREISLNDNDLVDASFVGRAIIDLPNLSYVNLDGNKIVRLSESTFVDNPTITRLTLARNRIVEIFAGSFQRLTNLRVLVLSHNRVRRVSTEFFNQPTSSTSSLEEIWLDDNDISDFNELRAILDALPGLKILDMSHNLLEAIPYGALGGHSNLERLHLDHNRLGFLQRESFVAMPALRELRLRNNSLNNLLETPFWNLPGLKGLDLSENYFRHLEPRLLANLPNLRRLDISGNGIALVDPESFRVTPSLEHVNISGNALSTLHPMTFRHLTSLYELDVGWNRLIEIVPGLPRNIEHLYLPMNRIVSLASSIESRDLSLPRLRTLDVSANGIETIVPGTFAELSSLRKLNFGYNALRLLDDGIFDGLGRLEKLDVRYNRIVSMHGRSLKPLTNLMDLNIRGNRLEVMRNDLFRENMKLRRLDISRNNLAQIPHATFTGTRELRELYASHNTLTELPVSLHDLKALEVLDLSFNKLNILSPETLSSLTSLLELKLVRNRIKELREGAFDRLPRLTLIDLENNDLRIIERNSIRSLPELQSLRLGKNRLRSIPSGAFSELPLLQSAELQENRIHEIAKNAFVNVPHLLFLNLSNNQLPEISHVGLESLRSLEVLDLSNNRLSRISSDSLASMEWLVELKMDNNRICSVQGSPFDDMPRLRVLSLRSNRMTTVRERAFKRLRSNIAVLDIDGNPLSCSCGMLWLRGWLQQESHDGPRCADGSLFKDIRLSRKDCQRSRQIETIYPGCQAETIDQSSSSLMSSNIYASVPSSDESSQERLNIRDPSSDDNHHQNSQNLDYNAYEEDYHSRKFENTSSAIIEDHGQSSTLAIPLATSHVLSPPLITDKPESSQTLVGAAIVPNNSLKKKSPTSEKISSSIPSPSSSGFTFFGVPLPGINFNLWGNTGTRKSQRKDDSGIFNEKLSYKRPGNGRYRIFPPTEPEIHRGGFFPLPRGQGGFVPIPDPRLTYETRNEAQNSATRGNNRGHPVSSSFNRSATITRIYRIPGERNSEKIAFNNSAKSRMKIGDKLTLGEREELTTVRNNAIGDSSVTNLLGLSSNIGKNRKNEKIPPIMSKISSLPTEITRANPVNTTLPAEVTSLPADRSSLPTELAPLSSEISSLPTELHESHAIGEDTTIIDDSAINNGIVWTSPSSFEITGNGENFTNGERDNLEKHADTTRIRKIGIFNTESRLPAVKDISAENDDDDEDIEDYYSTSILNLTFIGEKSSSTPQNDEILEASALSALLIPGGQITGSSASFSSSRPPSGRSTIVKVASPHSSLVADLEPSDNVESLVNTTSDRIVKIDSGVSSNASVGIIDDDGRFNWYFKNYNESNIEPYVAVIYSGVGKTFFTRFIALFFVEFFIISRTFL